ncbi:sugar-binding protein [Paenibacillus qinlingensis]|uniref:sugar-binding protein n=1 Tax=Paenibacillus qinlingensis TaxID=1837343 RepID=UPI001565F6F8|nr:sugar-binding protein [Paenibacillus qinlingensis]NQX64031.1 hypothetical protein [Paenibacillus qinlingensis]
MRKRITMLLIVTLLFSIFPFVIPKAEAAIVNVLSQDFETTTIGQAPAGWTATTGANLVSVAQDTAGNGYLTTTETNNSVANTATYAFAAPITTDFSVDMQVMTKQTSSSYEGYFLLLKDSAGDKVLELLFNGSTIARRYGSNLKSTVLSGIVANDWYNIHVDVNMTTKQYSVSIDGLPMSSATNVALYKQASEVTDYSFASYRFQSGTMQLDNITVSKFVADPTNQAPTASGVTVNGTTLSGQVLTGSYTYADTESNAQGTSTFKWYRGTNADGTGKSAISGATSLSYTAVAADVNRYLFFEVTPVATAGTLTGTPVLSPSVYIRYPGNVLAFDVTGRTTDALNQLNLVYSQSGVTLSSGSVTGIGGNFTYYSGAQDFKSFGIDVTYNKWTMNFTPLDDLSVYEATYDSQTGTLVDGNKVTLVRKLHPELMSDVQYVKATYVAASPITAGTKFLRVKMPTAAFNSGTASDFKVDQVAFEGSLSTLARIDGYVEDTMVDFSKYVSGGDTSNLQVVPLTTSTLIRTFNTTSYVKRTNPAVATTAMTFAAPTGKDFKSAYLEGYYYANLPSTPAFELWTSMNGTDFTLYNLSGIYKHPAFGSSANNSIPDTLHANYLPNGVKYVRVRLAGNIANGFPNMTKLAFGYGAEIPVVPADYDITIKKTASEITLDGVVSTDASGNPSGEWAGSELIRIQGLTDNNGDQHGADIYLKYDDKKLYLGAKIKDPTPMNNTRTGTGIWNGDALELFLGDEDMDFTQHPEAVGTMLPSDRQLVLGSGIENGYQWYMNTQGANSKPLVFMELLRDADGRGYTMEAAIPLYALGITNPWEGKALLLNAALSDGSYASRGQWGWTTNGESAKRARGQFGTVTFEQASAPTAEMSLSASYNNSTNLLAVTGQTTQVNTRLMTLLVKNAAGATVYFEQTQSNASGNFTFSHNLSALEAFPGTYTVKVGGDGVRIPRVTTVVIN